jgi:hypothetical protein
MRVIFETISSVPHNHRYPVVVLLTVNVYELGAGIPSSCVSPLSRDYLRIRVGADGIVTGRGKNFVTSLTIFQFGLDFL